MNNIIYLVHYCTGIYEDREDYPIVAFSTKEAATQYVNKCNEELIALELHDTNYNKQRYGFTSEWRGRHVDYTGAELQLGGELEIDCE